MSDSGQRTEQPTHRRLEKARKEGNFPSSREFLSAVQFVGFAALCSWFGAGVFLRLARMMKTLLAGAFSGDLTIARVVGIARETTSSALVPLMAGGGVLVILVIAAQLGTTRGGVSLKRLTPDFKRLNPITRLKSLHSQNLFLF